MRARNIGIAGMLGASVLAGLVACASDEDAVVREPDPNVVVPTRDGEADAEGDAEDAGDGGACLDCEWFPETCAGDVFCPNGPFGTTDGLDPRVRITVIRGRSDSDVWVAGALGALAHFDGSAWSRADIGAKESVRGLWLKTSTEVSFVSLDRLFARGMDFPDAGDAGSVSADGWKLGPAPARAPSYTGYIRTLHSAWAAPGATHLWGAVESICDGSFGCLFGPASGKSGLWRIRETAGGTFEIREGMSTTFCQNIGCGAMTAIHGSSPDDLWAVGPSGLALHVTDADGDTPTVLRHNTQTWTSLHGVWAANATDAWIVGAQGTIRRWRGHDFLWEIVDGVPTTVNLRAVSGSSTTDVWAVGDAATVLHWDGTTWSRVKIAGLEGRRPDLTAVWVSSPGHVWIGGQGVVLSLGGKP
jgi:hypothetical protein